jgi:hypothetical protein
LIEANYSILRYIPDPMRGEPVNIGIIIWTGNVYEFLLDHEALGRALTLNPDLEASTFEDFGEYLSRQLSYAEGSVETEFENSLNQIISYPLVLSDPIYTSMDDVSADDEHLRSLLFAEASDLAKILVHLRKRSVASRRTSAQVVLRQKLHPFIVNRRVREQYEVKGRNTGDPRSISFYANSGVNVGLDVVPLPSGKFGKQSVIRTADATAYELADIIGSSSVRSIVSYLPLDYRPEVEPLLYPLDVRLKDLGISLVTDSSTAYTEFSQLAQLEGPFAAD